MRARCRVRPTIVTVLVANSGFNSRIFLCHFNRKLLHVMSFPMIFSAKSPTLESKELMICFGSQLGAVTQLNRGMRVWAAATPRGSWLVGRWMTEIWLAARAQDPRCLDVLRILPR